jgi:scyllo-inositol 2-dehydrogenase (NADP+)
MNHVIRVGLIGFGMGGKVFHAPFIDSMPEFELVTIRTTKKEDQKTARLRYPDAKIVSDVQEIFKDNSIDLVVITTPNVFHFSLAKEALRYNKHVVVDKPFTITSAEAQELIDISIVRQKIITVFQNRRWDSDFKTVQKIIDSQVLGNLVSYRAHFDRFRNVIKQNAWKEENAPGAGILYDLGAHLIDQTLLLFGPPLQISSDIRIQRNEGKAADYFELILHYPQLKATLTAGMLVRPPAVKYLLSGSKGSFIKYGMDVQEEALKAGSIPSNTENWGEEPECLWGTLDTEYHELHFIGKIKSERGDYRQFYLNLYKALLGREQLSVRPEEARNTIRIIEHALKSNAEKRTVDFN